ncbi:MAG TPA: triose-phosphate isomerase family protein [Candidatus Babeliales bacterium]|nr:triose-phosphate isomerase family protein [Candidatus Babeliales bacterium]
MPTTFFVANWKMALPFSKTIDFCTKNKEQFDALGKKGSVILCPSFTALSHAAQIFKGTSIFLGGQNCGEFPDGAYTGEECAASLAQVGCNYCIIGHSERRIHVNETSVNVAAKVLRLFEQKICPIICIGETKHEHDRKETLEVLRYQLEPVFFNINAFSPAQPSVLIAYEPVWSIGSGVVPSEDHLRKVFDYLKKECSKNIPAQTKWHLLYGGSVDTNNAKQIKQVDGVDGFLIGGASLDFQNFKNIVSLF